MKNILLTYKVYLQTLINMRDKKEVKGDRETLKILKKELKKEGIEDETKSNNNKF